MLTSFRATMTMKRDTRGRKDETAGAVSTKSTLWWSMLGCCVFAVNGFTTNYLFYSFDDECIASGVKDPDYMGVVENFLEKNAGEDYHYRYIIGDNVTKQGATTKFDQFIDRDLRNRFKSPVFSEFHFKRHKATWLKDLDFIAGFQEGENASYKATMYLFHHSEKTLKERLAELPRLKKKYPDITVYLMKMNYKDWAKDKSKGIKHFSVSAEEYLEDEEMVPVGNTVNTQEENYKEQYYTRCLKYLHPSVKESVQKSNEDVKYLGYVRKAPERKWTGRKNWRICQAFLVGNEIHFYPKNGDRLDKIPLAGRNIYKMKNRKGKMKWFQKDTREIVWDVQIGKFRSTKKKRKLQLIDKMGHEEQYKLFEKAKEKADALASRRRLLRLQA